MERNLLFGVLALQSDAITPSQFVEACSQWAGRLDTPLSDLLHQRGWLTPEDRVRIEQLVERRLQPTGDPVAAVLPQSPGGPVAPAPQQTTTAEEQHTVDEDQGRPMVSTVYARPPTGQRYSLTRLHAKGGIGQVWLARDQELGREVALKQLRPEQADNALFRARFLEEAQITGQLEHPGIIPVYELVKTAQDQKPFYTMRFLRGRTLRDAVQTYHQKRLTADALELRELLGAFVGVCQAVAYAHSRGVIHRDLKGTNVALGDFGEVMVLDWGLAKLVGPKHAAQDVLASQLPVQVETAVPHEETGPGQVLGTPAYMAPEQAEGRLDQIDARTDVYGLGAILYEILAGRPPFTGRGLREVLDQVLHTTPAPPRLLVPATPPALQAVCLKALAKKPQERYAGAGDLARDVQRWLADEPVTAYREPLLKRLARWGRRHRSWVAGAAVLLVTAVAGLSVGTVLLGNANARTHAQWQRAEDNLRLAQTAAAKTRAVNRFLTEDLLAAARPEEKGKDVSLRKALDAAVPRIAEAFAGKPAIEASVRQTIGDTYRSLGLYAQAEPHLRKALDLCHELYGPEDPNTLEAVNSWALLLKEQGKLDQAEPLMRRNAEDRLRILGPDHPDTLTSVNHLAMLLFDKGQLPQAESLLHQNREDRRQVLGPDHRSTLEATNNLGMLLYAQGKFADAEPLFRSNLEASRRILGPDYPDTLEARNNLAVVLKVEGKLAEAEPLYRENLDGYLRVLGPDHPYTLAGRNNLAGLARSRGDLPQAEKLFRQNLEAYTKVLGPDHLFTLGTMNNLAVVLQALGKVTEAESLDRQGWEARRRVFGPDHPSTLTALNNLADYLQTRGKSAEAEAFFREALQRRRAVLPAGHLDTGRTLLGLGAVLTTTGKTKEAEGLLREAVAHFTKALGGKDPETANAESILGACLTALGRYAEAEPLLLNSYQTLDQAQGIYQTVLPQVLDRIIRLYQAWGKPEKAAPWRAQRDRAVKPGANPDKK